MVGSFASKNFGSYKIIMQGLLYQTLIASIIHKYNSGLLTEKDD